MRRCCRIYPPYAAVVMLSASSPLLAPAIASSSAPWLALTWSEPPSADLLFRHLLMPVAGVDFCARPLRLESRCTKSGFARLSATLGRGLLGTVPDARRARFCVRRGAERGGVLDTRMPPYNGVDTAASWAATGYFVLFFLTGILLVRHREAAIAWLGRVPRFLRPWLGSLLCTG